MGDAFDVVVTFNHLPAIVAKTKPALDALDADSAQRIAKEWSSTVPVDTGRLRDSITHDAHSAYTDVEYAPYVEFGTHRMAGHFDALHAATHEQERRQQPLKNLFLGMT